MGAATNGDAAFQRLSLAEQVANAVLALVSNDDLQPGAQLPSTGALADRFGVSRSVVREALAVLDGRGVIERSQGKEATVAIPGPTQLARLLIYRLERGQLSAEALMELRCGIEAQAARLAAERLDVAGAAALDQAFAALAAAQSPEERRDADLGFHRAVAFASGNELLALVLDALLPVLRQASEDAHGRRRADGGIADAVGEHRVLLAGILSGDPDIAARAMLHHLQR